jgi:hypothetical protein
MSPTKKVADSVRLGLSRQCAGDLLTAIDNFKTRSERIYVEGHIVSSIKGQAARTSANTRRAEASARTIRCSGIL